MKPLAITANAVVAPSRRVPPRIYRLTYRSRVNGRIAEGYCKVPYSDLFDLAEKMARLLTIGQVRWFRLDVASPNEIAAYRDMLTRWPEMLAATAATTKIDVLA